MESEGATVADLVEAAAAAGPGATAVVAGRQSLTYAELDAEANRLAHHLQSLGVGPDVLVGVCLPRSTDLAVALLAVLKAGGACVPLDPTYPSERLALLRADAGLTVLLTGDAVADRAPAGGGQAISVDADAAVWARRPASAPVRAAGPGDLGYVVYTSGSTGLPKGVMLTHRGLVNHHRAVVDLYGLGPGDRVLQFCSLGFDASIEEIFPTWAAGAAVVFRPDDAPLLGPEWCRWLHDQRITVVNLPTAYWQAWARDLDASGATVPSGIRLVVVGGEKARRVDCRTWQRVGGGAMRWVNAYGPTETTCMSTFYEAPPGAGEPDPEDDPPIGRPLPNTTVEVVDDALGAVAVGVVGELLIGGAGLARGYLHQPELTSERFVVLDTGDGPGSRMYRTGDLVRRLPGGDLDYVDRVDGQVKIRGFRVECGEVEAALSGHPDVAAAAVVPRDDPPGERQLAAYVVLRPGVTIRAGDVRRFLAERLPAHMVPASCTVVDDLPLTPNGKVDRDALSVRELPDAGGERAVARSAAEDRVAEIWGRVLGLEAGRIGLADDFFELGGHSLLATQVVAQLREEFGTATPLRALFELPTLGALAAAVEAERAEEQFARPLVPRREDPRDGLPLSPAQEQMWALEARARPPGLYNFTVVRRFDEPVDVDALHQTLSLLVARHEILRTGFAVDGDAPRQVVAPDAQVAVTIEDLRATPAEEREAELQRRIAEHEALPFDLSGPPLLRCILLHLDASRSRLAVTFDHLVSDGTGATIFLTELDAAYQAAVDHRVPALPPLAVQFGDFAVWQRARITEAVLGRQLGWWVHALRGAPPGPAVPLDSVPETPTRRIAKRPVDVSADVRTRLEEVARATGSTVFTVVAAAAAAVFGRHGGTGDVVLSTTVSGRNRVELENLIGSFSGMGRIRVDLSGDPSFAVIVARTREWVLGMFENQDIPFLRVRRAAMPDFPADPVAVAAALPVEFQYFHTGEDQEFFFRGQLHPLSLTLRDDGTRLAGEFSYKLDFYRPATVERLAADLERVLRAVASDPSLLLSELPVNVADRR